MLQLFVLFQCSREGWKEKLETQKNEGCEVHGYLEVTKVTALYSIALQLAMPLHNDYTAHFSLFA